LIGYCPQHDAIFPMLTVEETIKFYALVKGIRTSKIHHVVEKAIRELNLKDHRNKLAGTLSGGNKRKLSVAMALIGNPPIILLDEPSAGMDPEARRFMWQVVEKISQRDKRSAVILTTHSMEEAEALSTKMGIMVRGGIFRCMGSSQHIKNKFGVGYEIEIKVKKSEYHELQAMGNQLGFQGDLQTKVNLLGAVEQLGGADFDDLILDMIRPDGLGSDLAVEADLDGGNVRLRNLLEYLKSQTHGFSIIRYLTQSFEQVEVLEQCGEFFKLRVPKEGKTIGWLFGRLEQEKRNLGIQEYSVSQTTLEQIFQVFANQSIASDKAAFTFRFDGR
jgi:ATP-binding cassette subfamily A (ABC1) protein 3